jgi:hypothetical protein
MLTLLYSLTLFNPTPKTRNTANAAFAAGRFLAALLTLVVKPRKILPFFLIGGIVTSALAMNLIGQPGQTIVIWLFFVQVLNNI